MLADKVASIGAVIGAILGLIVAIDSAAHFSSYLIYIAVGAFSVGIACGLG